MAFNILDSLNNNSKNVIDDKPSASFRTKEISIFNIYRNEKNFYQIVDIEELANSILLVGLMSNLVVVYEPNNEGQEYKLISGERRLEALKSLYNKGHKEYEYVTCQVKKEQSEEEEEIEIIIANSSRVKTTAEMLQEAAKLKANLEKMRDEGKQLKGFDLNKGRLRDVVASILNMSKTKVAQIENINNNLDPNFRKELESGNLNFATANAIAGMQKEKQEELYEEKKDSIKDLKLKDIQDIKKAEQKEVLEQKEDYKEITSKDLLNQTKIEMKNNKFDLNKRYKFSLEKAKEYFMYNEMNFDIEAYKKYENIEVELLSETNAKVVVDNEAMYVNPNYCIEIDEQLEGQINVDDILNYKNNAEKLVTLGFISLSEAEKIVEVLNKADVKTNLYLQQIYIYLFDTATGEKKNIYEVVNDLYLLLRSFNKEKQKEIINKLLSFSEGYEETNNNDNILEKFEIGKHYVFSFEAYARYCKLHGPAVGGPNAHKYDWMEDLEGKEPDEFVTDISARIYTKDGWRYLRPYYFREMTPKEIEKKEEQIKNEKKLKRLEALKFEEGYIYKYSFAKKAEYEFLKKGVILRDKSRWDRENDGKEVKVITPRSAKLGDYRLNPWECVKSKIEAEEVLDLSDLEEEVSQEEVLEVLESLDRYNMTNLEKIKTFDTIYMSEFMFRMINKQCKTCPIGSKHKCIFYNTGDVTDRTCKKQIRIWLDVDNMLEDEFPGDGKNE